VMRDQRLSASKIFAQRLLSIIRLLTARVINAFRHQRFLHTNLKEVDLLGFISDQRLSASKIFALEEINWQIGLIVGRDQRLSASKIFALQAQRAAAASAIQVINAFRHQRFLHSIKEVNNEA